jgi:hypothetical protein
MSRQSAKTNTTSFSYVADGRFHSFSCNIKGRGAVDLVKAVRNVGFHAAVEFLRPPIEQEPVKEKTGNGVHFPCLTLRVRPSHLC